MNTVMNPTEEQTQAPARPEVREEESVEREYIRPAVNIYERPTGYVMEAELPGVNKDGLTVTMEGNVLTLEGRRTASSLTDAETLYRESSEADFRRVFQVDPDIDAAHISARMEQGLLTLTLPKKEAAKPHRIAVS